MLHHLYEVHFLYHYSLEFILDIFTVVLKSAQLESISDYDQRLTIITSNLFQVIVEFCFTSFLGRL